MSRSGKIPYSVVLTTFRRPRAAMAAAISVLRQERAPAFELIIVDNDPDGSALKQARRLARRAEIPVKVVHERRMGLASARNAGVRAADGEFIAFLDENHTVSPRWLRHLTRVQGDTDADIVFGAIHARLSESSDRHLQFYESFFARDPDHHEGRIDAVYDCRCSLIRRRLLPGASPFSLDLHDERDAIDPVISTAKANGCVSAWAGSAWVWQTPQRDQLSMWYALRASYNASRERTLQRIAGGSRQVLRSLASVVGGAGQAVVYAPIAFAMYLSRSERRGFAYRRLAEGLGRMLCAMPARLRGPDLELMPVAR